MITENLKAYDLLETFLKNDLYVVGNELTVADFACATSVTQLDLVTAIDAEQYPKTREWLDRLSKLPYFDDINTKAINEFKMILAHVKETNKKSADEK